MRIPCPFCGDRDHAEFAYLGDATVTRPPIGDRPAAEDARTIDYVYLRSNPAGMHQEFWQHTGGCRSWLVVDRDVTSHAIAGAALARQDGRR